MEKAVDKAKEELVQIRRRLLQAQTGESFLTSHPPLKLWSVRAQGAWPCPGLPSTMSLYNVSHLYPRAPSPGFSLQNKASK